MAESFDLTPEQVNEVVQALYARLGETRAYLRGYERDTVLPHHDDCCPRHRGWIASRRAERDSLNHREGVILGALDVLDPSPVDGCAVTAPDARTRLAEALAKLAPGGSWAWTNRAADALLPVVDAIAREYAAAELRKAADHLEAQHTALNALGVGVTRLDDLLAVENDLRARAGALDPEKPR